MNQAGYTFQTKATPQSDCTVFVHDDLEFPQRFSGTHDVFFHYKVMYVHDLKFAKRDIFKKKKKKWPPLIVISYFN